MVECLVFVLVVNVDVVNASVRTEAAHLVTNEIVVNGSQSVDPVDFRGG